MSSERGGPSSGFLGSLARKAKEIGLAISLTRAVGGGLESPTVQEMAGKAQQTQHEDGGQKSQRDELDKQEKIAKFKKRDEERMRELRQQIEEMKDNGSVV